MDSSRVEAVPNGTVHLDTVRALHQTVVSLRTALEVSKNELKELKEKYEQHSRCNEFVDVIEKLTIENHILRRKVIDSGFEEKRPSSRNINLELTYSPRSTNIEDILDKEVVIQTATSDNNATFVTVETNLGEVDPVFDEVESGKISSSENYNSGEEKDHDYPDLNISENLSSPAEAEENRESEQSQAISLRQETDAKHSSTYRTKLELLSKFDVKIKVKTLKEGAVFSSSTSDTDSSDDKKSEGDKTNSNTTYHFNERKEHFENAEDFKGNKINFRTVSTENVKMAVPNEAEAKSNVDKFDVQVRITSEENLIVKENVERRRKDTLNLDVDDLSLRSLSEGDNSVFTEGATTPAEPPANFPDEKQEQDNVSGNESEEVDDIELIFTTDESKDMSNLQEDLVSIQDSENWAPSSASTHSTPVLIKFHTLDPDFQPGVDTKQELENEEPGGLQNVANESSLRMKRVSLPSDKEIRHVAFNGKGSLDLPGRGILKSYQNKSDNMLYKKSPNTSTRRLDSIDSLTCEYNRGLSFDNTKSSSFELGSSMDILHREESVDSFHRPRHLLGHRFSVFAESDISKCGISEDDLASNLNVRRNTCPNPFQYRPLPQRGTRGVGGAGACGGMRVRPVLRSPGARRSSGAQTDVCALPAKCCSEPHLARQISLPLAPLPTLPQRAPVRRCMPPIRPAPPVRDDTRRLLLSDIGFTSMVPELSRSADPVWALCRRAQDSPSTTSTAKYLSRGSSYRSPCVSIDRSNDWIPQTVYHPPPKLYPDCRSWRNSLPDVRLDDTDHLINEAETYLRRSIDNLLYNPLDVSVSCTCGCSRDPNAHTTGDSGMHTVSIAAGKPYIPREPKNLRLGHAVKVIAPNGRLVIGRVRYVGLAGGTSATSSMVVGGEFPLQSTGSGLPRNDGLHHGRRYFLTPPHYTALFVPFSKVVMAWAN